jgi:hypothetical protein
MSRVAFRSDVLLGGVAFVAGLLLPALIGYLVGPEKVAKCQEENARLAPLAWTMVVVSPPMCYVAFRFILVGHYLPFVVVRTMAWINLWGGVGMVSSFLVDYPRIGSFPIVLAIPLEGLAAVLACDWRRDPRYFTGGGLQEHTLRLQQVMGYRYRRVPLVPVLIGIGNGISAAIWLNNYGWSSLTVGLGACAGFFLGVFSTLVFLKILRVLQW